MSLNAIPSVLISKGNKKNFFQRKSIQTGTSKKNGWNSLNQSRPKLKKLTTFNTPEQATKKKSGFNKNFKPATLFEIDMPSESKGEALQNSQRFIQPVSSGDILPYSSESLNKIEISFVLKAAEDKHHEFKMRTKKIEQNKQNLEDDENLSHMINEVNKSLSCKKFWINIESLVEERCSAFLVKVKAGAIREVKNVSLKTVLKSIVLVQTILIKILHQERNRKLSPLIYFLYDCLYNKYNKSAEETERKMIKIMQGSISSQKNSF